MRSYGYIRGITLSSTLPIQHVIPKLKVQLQQ